MLRSIVHLIDAVSVAATLAAGFVIFAAYRLIGGELGRVLSRPRPLRLLKRPVPGAWAEIIRENVPLSRDLSHADFELLLKLVQLFLHKKRVDGAGGLEMTEEIRVTVAALACILILRLEAGFYEGLDTVLVYPAPFRPVRMSGLQWDQALGPTRQEPVTFGESWQNGLVILSWDSVKHGAFDPRDGKNVALHEFAHQLDQETGDADGIPVGFPLSGLKPWAEYLDLKFRKKPRSERSRRPVMDPYGLQNRAEFFAVATETFFEKPRQLREKKPIVYRAMSDFYGFDPAVDMEKWPDCDSEEGPETLPN